ncbi:DUF3459 domain-containing protein [Aquicoccus sp. SCR17]|nr:DUF3459 domain-containing protein [Carideicomes alvinocaridis]
MNAETGTMGAGQLAGDLDWWRGAVIYQIYPRSYQDSNGDGVGDLLGIVNRLPHIASLGVDAIWISPFYTSPMRDFGYDVSDFCDVDPMFGSIADFDAVVSTAHRWGLRVMIDLVLSHTSIEHPWFTESRASRDNKRADWYVWADAKEDGTPPNNWLSLFGGSAWQWDTRREQYYLHNFLSEQPDLNFHAPAVQEALLAATRFWLDRGVDGFRLDTINFYFCDKDLRDNPVLPADKRNATLAPRVNPYNYQDHIYSKNRVENFGFLRRFRALLDEYPGSACVGEVGDAQRGMEIMAAYTKGDDFVHMCYAFELLAPDRPSAARVAEIFATADAELAGEGWACWAFSNHDVARHVTRWQLTPAAHRAYMTLLMCLKGSACLYQGEELGLPEAELHFDDLQDPYGKEFWPEYKGRDGARTPMVWDAQAPNAGFTTARPWLPVTHEHQMRAVSEQEGDPASILHHYRRAIAFRHAQPALRRGEHDGVKATGDVVHFIRRHEGDEIFVAVNLSGDPAALDMPAGDWHHIGTELGSAMPSADGRLHLGPWQPCLLMRQ